MAFFWILFLLGGCKKLVTVNPPPTAITGEDVFNSNATAIAVVTGIYTQISLAGANQVGVPAISEFAGLSADELTCWAGSTNEEIQAAYTNSLSVSIGGTEFWQTIFYPFIYTCNSAIEGLTSTSSLSPGVRSQLLGEAYFMRAYCYFYLVNLYGPVPLAVSSNYVANEDLSRSDTGLVYQQIISDLKVAKAYLNTNYLDGTLLNPTTERVRPTKWAAHALLARAYLYDGQWINAEQECDTIIANTGTYFLDTLNGVFLKNSNEAIWQIQPVSTYGGITNTQDAYLFILPSIGPNNYPGNPVYLSPYILNAFEAGDQRRLDWVDSVIVGTDTYYFPFKYKVNEENAPVTEYLMMLRLGEQYLIRSEARYNQGNYTGAITDLNVIRSRAGLSPSTASAANLKQAIIHERQVELFTEMGQRWFDLKRENIVDSVMTPVCLQKGGTWSSNWTLYPIPLSDIQEDHNLVQNPGYN